MKQAIIALALALPMIGIAKGISNENKRKECKETYEDIKSLLDKKVITIEEAQKLWAKWEKDTHNR